uniref:ER membrane protein complex subunit 1 n=1 Tax=Odontella aurita TaxID=265563 RepID=A0A6U6JLV7_9STRA
MAIAAAAEDVITITFDLGAGATTARRTGATELHPLWTSLASIHPPTDTVGAAVGGYDGYVTIAGDDDRYPTTRRTAALYRFDPTIGKIRKQLYEGPSYHEGEEENQDDAVVRCADIKLTFEYDIKKEMTSVNAYRVKGEEVVGALAVSGNAATSLLKGAPLKTDHTFVLKCSPSGASILATATGGTTLYLTATFQSSGVSLNLAWSAEEALGAISSATFLDESHVPVPSSAEEEEDEEEALIHGLSFPSRLASQADSLKSFLAGGVATYLRNALFSSGDGKSRDAAFGFSKVAVLLNARQHMLVGSELGGRARGALRWTKRLDPSAAWHRVIHGGPSARTGVNGGQDGHALHGHEILVLSYVPAETGARGYSGEGGAEGAGTLRWTCLDGLTGRVHHESKIELGGGGGGVAQIVPLHSPHHAAGECRQMAALVREDDSVGVVPDTPHAREVLGEAIRTANGGNGLYAHTLNRSAGDIRSLRIESSEAGSKAMLVGEASFSPDKERVVSVAYPRRNEVIQSPATILGDDSLLLKYLNPHLCVVVTEATPAFLSRMGGDDDEEDGGFHKALGTEGKGSGGDSDAGKTKPLGVTKPGEESPSAPPPAKAPIPSLFVNVLDTVSGRVLHRASHSRLPDNSDSLASTKSVTNVPVLISENWIVYAFPNARTQRTELGVLTLHEGMIDKTGITMTSSPDQDLSFSSLTSPRPIVLSKTYGLQVPVKALGITTTRGGISVKHVLLSTGVKGSVSAVDRRTLDPRRPTGEPKQSEKAEGLIRYFPLIPLTTKFTPSYDLEVRDAAVIESAAAQVESASLTLAFGGPDVFYARLSPSRGFDLLPDSFNRPLLSVVVLGLVAVVVALKGMSNKKMVAVGWT